MQKRMGPIFGILTAAFFLSAAIVSGQQPRPAQGEEPQERPRPDQGGRHPRPPQDPLSEAMFPPELVMQHQRELQLTDAQKTFMREEIQQTTTRFNELQWQLQDSVEALGETMKSNAVNEQLALSQLDKVLDTEREIKRLHIGMAIRIKNKLTAEQQTKLQEIKRHMEFGPDGPGRGPGGPGGPGRGPGGPGGPGGGPGRPGGPGGGPGQGSGPGRP